MKTKYAMKKREDLPPLKETLKQNSTKSQKNLQIRNNNKILQTKQHNQVWQKEVLHGIRIQINKSTTDEIETFWKKNMGHA